jgi:hypothetical protein
MLTEGNNEQRASAQSERQRMKWSAPDRRRARWVFGLLIAGTLLAAATDGAASSPCGTSKMADAGARFEREERLLFMDGRPGYPWLCLYHDPANDVYVALLTPIESLAELRAAKAAATRQLQQSGFDPCRVVFWVTNGDLPRLPDGMDELLNSVVECAPRVIAGDAGAEEWLPDAQAAVATAVEITARDMGWRPSRPLTIVVTTEEAAAVAAYQRYVISGYRGDDDFLAQVTSTYEQLARRGAGSFDQFTATGSLIVLNLSRTLRWEGSSEGVRAAIGRKTIHEYTHFAQRGILGKGSAPRWFKEGQAVHQERRFAGRSAENLLDAMIAEKDGTAPRLSELIHEPTWGAEEAGDHTAVVYGRGYATYAFLVERFGFPTTVQLLRENRGGGQEQFQALLTELTGLELDALDAAVSAWLAEPGRVLLRDEFRTPSGYWRRYARERSRAEYVDAEYAVTRLAGSETACCRALGARVAGDFELQVDARVVQSSPGARIDLIVVARAPDTAYAYRIDPSEWAFALEQWTGDEWASVIDWTEAPGLESDPAASRLSLRVQRGRLTLSANGLRLAGADHALPPGLAPESFFVGVGHRADEAVEARFSRLVVANVD